MPHDSWLSPLLEERPAPNKGGAGLFAREAIPAGTLLLMWGGRVIDGAALLALPADRTLYTAQVDEDLYLMSVEPGPGDRINHSCAPNAGFRGQIAIVAMRDIAASEEVCIDYAMTDGSPYDEFDCGCGAPNCRGRVRGDDWRLPALQAAYAGFFSPYLARRIAALGA